MLHRWCAASLRLTRCCLGVCVCLDHEQGKKKGKGKKKGSKKGKKGKPDLGDLGPKLSVPEKFIKFQYVYTSPSFKRTLRPLRPLRPCLLPWPCVCVDVHDRRREQMLPKNRDLQACARV